MECAGCNHEFDEDSLHYDPTSGDLICAKCMNQRWRDLNAEINELEERKDELEATDPEDLDDEEREELHSTKKELVELKEDRENLEQELEGKNISEPDVSDKIYGRRVDEETDLGDILGGESPEDFMDHTNLDD